MQEDTVMAAILDIIKEMLGARAQVGPDTNLLAAGVDSMGLITLVARCEQVFELDFEPEHMVMERLATVRLIAALLRERYGLSAAALP